MKSLEIAEEVTSKVRIAVTAADNVGLDGLVSSHFGRSPYFVLVDLDNGTIGEVRVVSNPYYANHAPGQVPAFVHSQDADVMVSGGMGAGAISFFNQYGIEVATGASGTVREALDSYLASALAGDACCPGGHGDHSSCH